MSNELKVKTKDFYSLLIAFNSLLFRRKELV